MSTNDLNIDSLLDDLDNVVGSHSNSYIKVPHPPSYDKGFSQSNPKSKFTVSPRGLNSKGSLTGDLPTSKLSRSAVTSIPSFNVNASATVKNNSTQDVDNSLSLTICDKALDNLLSLINAPDPILLKSTIETTNHNTLRFENTKDRELSIQDNTIESILNIPLDLHSSRKQFSENLENQSTKNNENDCNQRDGIFTPFAFTNINQLQQGISNSKANRCLKIILGGSGYIRGVKLSSFSKSVCDCLRCLDCNFMVFCFRDAKWSGSDSKNSNDVASLWEISNDINTSSISETVVVDYMFFRNNVPNQKKLCTGLQPASSWCAYCCQCHWISVQEEMLLVQGRSPSWICAGHGNS